MEAYSKDLQIRWADLDPNFHLRHSVYYDYGAFCRVSFLEEHGLSNQVMQQLQIGPILWREEAQFRKEVRLGDRLRINLKLLKAKKDFSRWSIRHELIKNDEQIAALITVEGAWIDLVKRRLATPDTLVVGVFEQMPKDQEFCWHGA